MTDFQKLMSDIRETYLGDRMPWVIGFSGGKDSTTVLQLVFYSLSALPKARLTKAIHVICNDTLVENPAIVEHVDKQLEMIRNSGKKELFRHEPGLFVVAKVKPDLDDRFWVNLIGKGYPSPNRWFRWCTERMKINPTTRYVLDSVDTDGRVVIILGSRSAESSNRAASMRSYERGNRLRQHSMRNAFVYTPIAELSNDEVWAYLLQVPCPWGGNNRQLLGLYRNACTGGECPFVIEVGTQSCGKSRFGCWVCTVVDKDRSMENFILNGYDWMEELLGFRNWLYDIRQQDYQYVPKHLAPKARFGPFLHKTRHDILTRLLRLQGHLPVELISEKELERVRHLLGHKRRGATASGVKRFVVQLHSGRTLKVLSDLNVLESGRKRLGPFPLANARVIREEAIGPEYSQSTRIMFYEVRNGNT